MRKTNYFKGMLTFGIMFLMAAVYAGVQGLGVTCAIFLTLGGITLWFLSAVPYSDKYIKKSSNQQNTYNERID